MGDADEDGADDKTPPSLDEFSDRLDRLRGSPEPENPRGGGAAWGRAMRVSSELLAGLFVGALLGLGLDRWLGTEPWFLLAGIGLGFAAGLRNLTRAVNEGNEDSSNTG
ncbi:MAG: AtpZ/AtpI family protein [Hyphococcus sp.]